MRSLALLLAFALAVTTIVVMRDEPAASLSSPTSIPAVSRPIESADRNDSRVVPRVAMSHAPVPSEKRPTLKSLNDLPEQASVDFMVSKAERFARLDRAVAMNRPDSDWEPRAEITDALESLDKSSKVIDIQCDSNLCRVEIMHTGTSDKGKFLRALSPHLPPRPTLTVGAGSAQEALDVFRAGVLWNGDNNNPGVTHLYVSRPGRHFGEDSAPAANRPPEELSKSIEHQMLETLAARNKTTN